MAKDISANAVARWIFWLTFIGVVLYVAAVFIFVLGSESEDRTRTFPSATENEAQ